MTTPPVSDKPSPLGLMNKSFSDKNDEPILLMTNSSSKTDDQITYWQREQALPVGDEPSPLFDDQYTY